MMPGDGIGNVARKSVNGEPHTGLRGRRFGVLYLAGIFGI